MHLVHEYGGRNLWHRTRSWSSLRLDLGRWQVKADEGVTRPREHLLFVTLAGSIRRTAAAIEDGHHYDGAEFPGAVSFVPSRRRRHALYGEGVITYAAIRLDPGTMAGLDGIDPDRLEFAGFTNQPDPFIHQLSLALGEELGKEGVAGQLFADSAATTLLAHLVRRYSNAPGALRRGAGRQPGLPAGALRDVLDYINAHLGEDLRLARLAEIAGVGEHRLSRGFKAATGVSPHRYVTSRRLERAALLLRRRSGLSIADIAYRVGLSSQSHLTTAFRRHYGMTPRAYRLH